MPDQAVTRFILWRHGQTDWNLQCRFQGQADQPLNADGLEQAVLAAEALAAAAPDAIVSSPLDRALTTARALAERTGLPVCTDERLQEINVGSWAGMLTTEVFALEPEFAAALAAGRDWRRSPTGETCAETGRRAADCLRELAGEFAGRTVVVVSHGLTIRMLVANLLGWDHHAATTLVTLTNCAWSVLVHRGGRDWKLVAWQRTADARPG